MNLVRDCLDKHLIDKNKRPMGRVDGIILEFQAEGEPRVSYIEIGLPTRADRVSTRLRGLLKRVLKSERYRIPWGKLTVGLNEVKAEVEAEKTPVFAAELWLRKNVIGKIPGARHGKL